MKRKANLALLRVLPAALLICGQALPREIFPGACPPSVHAQAFSPGRPIFLTAPEYKVRIIKAYPHDPGAFTEGLLFRGGFLYESTGLNGRSGIRKVEPETGRVVKKHDLQKQYFGEGLTDWGDCLVQLTWHSGRGFVYDLESFELKSEFSYTGEGWGISRDEKNLIMSDGTNRLRFLNPLTFQVERVIEVHSKGRPIQNLNELEYVNGEIFANVWLTDLIARISPETGEVTGWIDLSDLRRQLPRGIGAEALNGIAWDRESGRLFVTGKHWPMLFEVEIIGQGK